MVSETHISKHTLRPSVAQIQPTCGAILLVWNTAGAWTSSPHRSTRPQVSWQPHGLIDQLGEQIVLHKLGPSLFTLWLIHHMLPILGADYRLFIYRPTAPCSTNPLKGSLSKIQSMFSELGLSVTQLLNLGSVRGPTNTYENAQFNILSPHLAQCAHSSCMRNQNRANYARERCEEEVVFVGVKRLLRGSAFCPSLSIKTHMTDYLLTH